MLSLREQIKKDCQVFINPNEFGELHKVDGNEIMIVIDEDSLIERQKGIETGVAESSLLFFAKVEDLPKRKNSGERFNVDGRVYIVDNWSESGDIAQIALSQNIT